MGVQGIKNDWLRRLVLVVIFVPVIIISIALSLIVELWKCLEIIPAQFMAGWLGEDRYWRWFYSRHVKS